MVSPRISPIAVVVAAIAAFMIGFLWYSPALFGGLWMQAHGYTPEHMEAMKSTLGRTYGISFVCQLVIGAVLSQLLYQTSTVGAAGGAGLGFLAWLGFAATIGLTSNLFSEAPLTLYAVDAGYQLVYLVVMGAILGAWRARAVKAA